MLTKQNLILTAVGPDKIGLVERISEFIVQEGCNIEDSKMAVFCGEFGFPPDWNGQRGFGRFRTSVPDEAAAGEKYHQWLQAAAKNPWCVGVSFFQYRDQPVTGRGPVGQSAPEAVHGENYAFGLVDLTNRPRPELLARVREANLAAPQWRLLP